MIYFFIIKIGEKIRRARKIKAITQENLANAIGVSDKSVSAYESERVSPPLKVLEKIAEQTDQSLAFFLEENIENSIMNKLKEVEKQLSEIKILLEATKLQE